MSQLLMSETRLGLLNYSIIYRGTNNSSSLRYGLLVVGSIGCFGRKISLKNKNYRCLGNGNIAVRPVAMRSRCMRDAACSVNRLRP